MVEAVTIVRSLHILFAVVWAGASFHFARITNPALTDKRFEFLAHSKHGPFMGVAALGTVGFGLATYLMVGADAYTAGQNAVLGIGMLAGVVAMLVGYAGHLPNSVRIKRALEQEDGDALKRLGRREDRLDHISIATVGVALLAMIVFRWF